MKNNMKDALAFSSKKGQGLIEIAVTIAIVAIVTIATFTPMGETVARMLSSAAPTASQEHNINKSIVNLENIVLESESLQVSPTFQLEEGVVPQVALQDKIDTVQSLVNGKDLTPEQFNALLEFLDQNASGGIEVSGVLSKFLLDDLTDAQMAELAEKLGLSPEDFTQEDIISKLGLEDVELTLGLTPEILATLESIEEDLAQKASERGASEAIKDAYLAFSAALTSKSPTAILGVLNEYPEVISGSNQLKQAIVDLMKVGYKGE